MRSGSQTTLGEIATFEMGQAPPGVECNKTGKGTVFVKAGEFASLYPEEKEWTTKPLKFGKRGDIFICVVGATAGKLNLGIDCAIGRSVAAIRPNEGINAKFVYYQLQPHVLKLRAASSGSAQGVISKTQLQQIPFLVVPLDQQKLLVAEVEKQFSRLDEAVANLKRVKANLKRYKAAVFKAAVEGKLTEDWRKQHPNVEPPSKLLERILGERRAKWRGKGKYKEAAEPDVSNFIPLPETWAWASLDQLSWDSSYGTSVKCNYNNSGPAVLRIPNIALGKLDLRDLKFAPDSYEIGPGNQLSVGDLLIIRTNGSRNLIGRSAVVRQPLPSVSAFASYLIRFRLAQQLEIIKWLGTIWDAEFFRVWIEQRASTSAGQHNISMSLLARLPIPIPPLAEQDQIVAEVERSLSVLAELETAVQANLTRANRLRQSVLSQAFSGRLPLSNGVGRIASLATAARKSEWQR